MIDERSTGADRINRSLFDSMEDSVVEMTPAVVDFPHPVTAPFGQISVCRSKDDTTRIIALIISERLNQNDDQKQNLVTALQSYFEVAGIENDYQLTSLDPHDWPTDVIKDNPDYKALTVPVMSSLKKLTSYIKVVMDNGHYIRKSSTFRELQTFVEKQQRQDEETLKRSMTLVSSAPSKIPDFVVPRLNEYTEGQEYLKSIEQVFTSNALSRYLSDAQYCKQHLEWSSALVSRIREALNESPILAFLAAVHEKEQNCHQLFMELQTHFNTGDLTMSRTFAEWQQLFGLHCDTMDGFLPYYSSVRKIVDRLKDYGSSAIKDDVFIRAYLCKSLDVKELRTYTKEFMWNTTDDSLQILNKVHRDYSGIVASSSIRETYLSTARSSRRTEIRSKEVKSPTRARFPPNTGNKLPHHVYTQVKEWFELMTVPAADRKPDFLDGFTYTHKKPEVKVVYRDKPETQKHQRRITNRSGSGSSKSTGRNARRRKRNSRGSKSRSRSRSRDRKIPSRSRSRDHKIQGKPTHGRSAARRSRSRRRSRSTSGGGSL